MMCGGAARHMEREDVGPDRKGRQGLDGSRSELCLDFYRRAAAAEVTHRHAETARLCRRAPGYASEPDEAESPPGQALSDHMRRAPAFPLAGAECALAF